MTLGELKSKIDQLIEKSPRAANSEVLVDTEARRFHAHYIQVENIYFDAEFCDAAGLGDFSTLHIDLTGAET